MNYRKMFLSFAIVFSMSLPGYGVIVHDTTEFFPHQVAIVPSGNRIKNDSLCSGALLNHRWVLTSADCVKGSSKLKVALGSASMVGKDPHRVTLSTSAFYIHEKFRSSSHLFNIALVKLPKSVSYNRYIQPVQLPEGPVDTDYTPVSTSGWGSVDYDPFFEARSALRSARAYVVPDDFCARNHRGYKVDPRVLCVKSAEPWSEKYRGRTGDPLVFYTRDSTTVHVGVFIFLSHKLNYHDVIRNMDYYKFYTTYTDTFSYKDWIVATMKTKSRG